MRSAIFLAAALGVGAAAIPVAADEISPEQQLADASQAFDAAGKDCATRCKALASMERAAEKLCELAQDGSDGDRARCVEAKKKVAHAREVLRADCPDCVKEPAPPQITATPIQEDKSAGRDTYPPPPVYAGGLAEAAYQPRASSAKHRFITVRTSLLRSFEAPPFFARLGFEIGLVDRVSLALLVGGGSIRVGSNAGDVQSDARSGVFEAGLEARGYLVGTFSAGGLAFGVQLLETRVATQRFLGLDLPVQSDFIVPGVTFAPVAAYKFVLPIGLTLDATLGAAFVAHREAPIEPNAKKVVPLADFSIGWSF